MNWKTLGDLAQNCVIGELAKYGLGVAFPLSDNYPFDIIIIANNNLFKTQVRGSSSNVSGAVYFKLKKNNFYQGTSIHYTNMEVDLFALWDFKRQKLHLISHKETNSQGTISIRYETPRNNIKVGVHQSAETLISEDRIKALLAFNPPNFSTMFSKSMAKQAKQYKHVCEICQKEFENGWKNSRFCGAKCKGVSSRKVIRPTKEQLELDMQSLPMIHVGAKYGVSDNAVRKWAKTYGLIV